LREKQNVVKKILQITGKLYCTCSCWW